jgi:hypothetical protein
MKHCNEHKSADLSGITDSLKGLVGAQVALGREIVKLFVDGAGGALGVLRDCGIGPPKHSACCEIPEPCWMPVSGGEVECSLRPGGQGQVTVTLTNGDHLSRTFAAHALGTNASLVSVSPANVTLPPKGRATITFTFTMPSGGSSAQAAYDFALWIVGCRSHYVRWEIDACGCEDCCRRHLAIEDRPDYVVHWYDHFYCAKPCFGPLTKLAPHP